MGAQQRTVLVVDDNTMNMELTADLLALAGYRVIRASSAEEALPLARSERPDLVLMDLALPGMDGLEATRRLLLDPATRDIPVVALTASAMRSDECLALGAGCRAVIRKPIDTRAFNEQVAAFLGVPS